MIDEKKINNLLVRASQKGDTETVKGLLEAGADVHARQNYALQWASGNGHTETVKVLQEAMNSAPAKVISALQVAFKQCVGLALTKETAKVLIQAIREADSPAPKSKTPAPR